MGIIWYIYLILSAIAIIIVIAYTLISKRSPIFLKVIVVLLLPFFLYFIIAQYTLYKKQKPFSKIEQTNNMKLVPLSMPLEDGLIKEYLRDRKQDNRPIIIAIPIEVQIRFTDPINPNSPYAIIRVLFINKGNLRALDMSIKWNIIDNGRRITPPDEWGKIIGKEVVIPTLDPNQNFVYLYGPEIGVYAVSGFPKIELTLRVTYKGEDGKEYSYYCRSTTNPKEYPDRNYLFDVLDVK